MSPLKVDDSIQHVNIFFDQVEMKRYEALLKDTWWLWLTVVPAGCLMGAFFSFVFFITVPICFFAFIYFGLMRYDAEGNAKGDLGD